MFKPGDKIISAPREVELDDGKHWRAKLGFILMSTDLAAESDFFSMVPDGVAVHITRLKTDDYTTNETLAQHLAQMADAAALEASRDSSLNSVAVSVTGSPLTSTS